MHSFSAVKIAYASSSVDGDDDLDTFFIEYVVGFQERSMSTRNRQSLLFAVTTCVHARI